MTVLGTTLDIAHDAVFLSSNMLQFAPVPILVGTAKVLLRIWSLLEYVNVLISVLFQLCGIDKCHVGEPRGKLLYYRTLCCGSSFCCPRPQHSW